MAGRSFASGSLDELTPMPDRGLEAGGEDGETDDEEQFDIGSQPVDLWSRTLTDALGVVKTEIWDETWPAKNPDESGPRHRFGPRPDWVATADVSRLSVDPGHRAHAPPATV